MADRSSPEEWLLALAATQLGLFTLTQALTVGVTRSVIRNRLARGAWKRVHRGVFCIAGHAPTPATPHMAAVLAGGRTARSSHRAAAWGWGMTPYEQKPEITTTDERLLNLPEIHTHRTRTVLSPPKLVRGVPTTSAAETLLDLGAVHGLAEVRSALDRAIANRSLTPMDALAELDRRGHVGVRGTAHLRALLDSAGVSGSHSPSVLEARTRRLIQRVGLRQPDCEKVAGPNGEYRLDFPWPEAMLVVEVNGWEYHSSYKAFHYGMTRQNALTLEGYAFLNYTWTHITRAPNTVMRELHAAYLARVHLPFGGLRPPSDRNPPKVA